LPVDPEEFLKLSEEHCTNGKREIEFRSSVRLAYYAAHHQAKGILPSGIAGNTGRSVHQEVIDSLFNIGDPILRAAGHALNYARSLRRRSDYELTAEVRDIDARTVINSAKNVFLKIEEYSKADKS
jgi:uncharacterized protein (UPF0332 family)